MASRTAVVLLTCVCAATAGCATVAVYEPETSTEISLASARSELRDAASEYCDVTLDKGLARGESGWGSLADAILGGGDDSKAYWRRIDAEASAPVSVMEQVRSDAAIVSNGLSGLNTMAKDLLGNSKPTRGDVAQFERALIHARQARDSLSDAIMKVSANSSDTYDVATELGSLDTELSQAAETADDLATARASNGGAA